MRVEGNGGREWVMGCRVAGVDVMGVREVGKGVRVEGKGGREWVVCPSWLWVPDDDDVVVLVLWPEAGFEMPNCVLYW